MKQQVISRAFFKALSCKEATARFKRINANPDNEYLTGYEKWLNYIPVIHGEHDPEIRVKLDKIEKIFEYLSNEIMDENFVTYGWPEPGKMLKRVILAIDENGGELVLVKWNPIVTPIHGHAYGQMTDYLISGKARETEYEISNERNRIVTEIGYESFSGPQMLSNGFHSADSNVSRGALIHKFEPLTKCETLHYIPEHPRDGRGNLFNEPKN